MFTNFKNSFTSRQNDKCVVKKIITPLMLGYITLWHIINYNTYFNWLYFSDIHILQGSVATCLRHDGIFKHTFVANLLRSQKFRTSVNIWWSYEQEFGDLFFFLDSRCISRNLHSISCSVWLSTSIGQFVPSWLTFAIPCSVDWTSFHRNR